MKNSTKILAAVAVGVVAGGVLGLLFAPDKGDETRKKINKKGEKMFSRMKGDFNKEKLNRIKEKLENKLKNIAAKMEQFAKEDSKPA